LQSNENEVKAISICYYDGKKCKGDNEKQTPKTPCSKTSMERA
jgi:hypothetical protein